MKTATLESLITTSDVANVTGLKAQTLAKMRTEGRGPRFIKLDGGKVCYRPSDIAAWLERNAHNSTSTATA